MITAVSSAGIPWATSTTLLGILFCFQGAADGAVNTGKYLYCMSDLANLKIDFTRMHSSMMRTVRCSGRLGKGGSALRGCLPVGLSA